MRETGVYPVERGNYYLADYGGSVPMAEIDESDKLIFPATSENGGARITTGTFWGSVEITAEALDSAPPRADSAWEHVEETQLVALGTELALAGNETLFDGLPHLHLKSGQRYWLRVSSRGREDGKTLPDPGPEEPVESHLVQFWTEHG